MDGSAKLEAMTDSLLKFANSLSSILCELAITWTMSAVNLLQTSSFTLRDGKKGRSEPIPLIFPPWLRSIYRDSIVVVIENSARAIQRYAYWSEEP
jgi:hypothetical protein